MEYEDIPQIQVLRGGSNEEWCSVITCVRWNISLQFDPELLAQWTDELHSRPGLKAYTVHQKGTSLIFDISVHPRTPISEIKDFQIFLAHGLRRHLGVIAEIVPYTAPKQNFGS